MSPIAYKLSEVPEDNPIALLSRKIVRGEKAMIAEVKLAKGCHVDSHCHESEQISIMLSGHVVWSLGKEGTAEHRTTPMTAGGVLVVPSGEYHGLDVIEDAIFFDVLSPIGLMGVDRQGR